MARRNFFNRENNNLRRNQIEEELEEQEESLRQNRRERSSFRQDRRGFQRSRAPSRIPIPIRRERIIDGTTSRIRPNQNHSFTEPNVPHQLPGETPENSGIVGDYIGERE